MILLNTRGDVRLLVLFVIVELVRDLAKDRDEFRLPVELEAFVHAPVNLNFRELEYGRDDLGHARWMAKVGIRSKGRLILMSLDTNDPFLSAVTILPARLRSRSNHECQIPPPYVSTPTWR